MSDTRGVFSLRELYELKTEDQWVPLNEVWVAPSPSSPAIRFSDSTPETPNTGYFGGGYAFGTYSTMDKVTYASDTTAAVPGANLTVARSNLAATGNLTHGYFGGGATTSLMDKVTYSSDTTASVPGANLTLARYWLAATGNTTHGYFGGGDPGSRSTMDKVTYSSDTTVAVPGANLTLARYGLGATGNATHGYFGGGESPSTPQKKSTMDKVTYSTDTTAAVPGANLTVARSNLAASSALANGLPSTALLPTPVYL